MAKVRCVMYSILIRVIVTAYNAGDPVESALRASVESEVTRGITLCQVVASS